jgi:hypothetical protein
MSMNSPNYPLVSLVHGTLSRAYATILAMEETRETTTAAKVTMLVFVFQSLRVKISPMRTFNTSMQYVTLRKRQRDKHSVHRRPLLLLRIVRHPHLHNDLLLLPPNNLH